MRARVDRSEWRWAWGWALVVVAVTCLPYLYAWFAAPPGHVFGGFLVNTRDGNSYLAKMRQGYGGSWLFRLPYTPEEQRGIFFYTFYLSLGHVTRLTGLPFILVFHAVRVLCGLFLLLTAYRFAAEATPGLPARRWTFAIVAFGGGLAAVSLVSGRNHPDSFVPVDLFIPEAIGFYSSLINPHFPLGFALMAWAILWVWRPPWAGAWVGIGMAALTGVGVVMLAPFLVPVVWAAAGLPLLSTRPFNRAALWRAAALGAASGALLLYYVWASRADPAVAAWSAQNVTPSPPPLDYLLGFGLWLPLAALGLWRLIRLGVGSWDLGFSLLGWIAAVTALLYFPFPLQRRFVGGLFIPLAVLSGVALPWLFAQLKSRALLRFASAVAIILFGFSSNAIVLAAVSLAPSTAAPDVYLTSDEAAALRWLEARATSNDIVLADVRLGNFVPAWTAARVVYGHPMETVGAALKRAEVESYYAGGDASVVERYEVRYIIGGPMPEGWRVAFESGAVKIYAR
jgi:hypothetical protein